MGEAGRRAPERPTAWARAAPGKGLCAFSDSPRGEGEGPRALPRGPNTAGLCVSPGGLRSSPDARTHLAARTTPPRGPHHSTAPPPQSTSRGAQTLQVPPPTPAAHTRLTPPPGTSHWLPDTAPSTYWTSENAAHLPGFDWSKCETMPAHLFQRFQMVIGFNICPFAPPSLESPSCDWLWKALVTPRFQP